MKPSKFQVEAIAKLLKGGKPLPEDYKNILFPATKKEYELIYSEKEREEDILAETMAVPLQPVKTFGENGKEWTNKLIFGDNLQALKTLMTDSKIKGNVKLIYIDPPFSTKQDFKGSQDQKAYQDKICGAKFLEFLRKRLVFLRELLSEDGCIFLHLDYRKKHYIKVLMDEIFNESNFRNEIAINRIKKNVRERERVKKLNEEFDTILFYSKSDQLTILPPTRKESRPDRWHAFDAAGFRTGMDYEIFGFKPAGNRHWHWTREKAFHGKNNYEEWFEKYSKKESLGEYWVRTGRKLQFVRSNSNTGKPEYFIPASEESLCNNLWSDISGYSFNFQYPTEKSEALLERIINMNTGPDDLIMDCFSGSGTSLVVAEKLGRRWIGVDCGKLAIYVTQKRLLRLFVKDDKKQATPFTLYNAGLYDYQKIKELAWEEYRIFALKLFQCRDEKHAVSKIDLDGYLGGSDALVFNYQKHKDIVLDRGFIDDLHSALGNKIGDKFFIISPAANVKFLEDYIEKDKVKYYILRIPYSIINELHQKDFQAIRQPVDEMDVNDTVEAVGFDFIQIPEVECEYFQNKTKKNDLFAKNRECVIKIKKFESQIISKKPLVFKNRETLSMIMLDYDYDGKVFDIDDVFYAESLQNEDYEVRFGKDKIKDEMMIIYVDIFGNEKREIKKLTDFKIKK